MLTTQTGKLIAAFFLGLVVALGSAFLFLRSSRPEMAAQPPMAAPVATVPAQKPADPPVAVPAPAASAVAAPAAVSPKQPVHVPRKPKVTKPAQAADPEPVVAAAPTPVPAPAETLVASNRPAPAPVFTPAPAPVAAPPQPHIVTLQAGTVLNVRLNEVLSSEKNVTGDAFRATLTAPVIVDGFIIADRGARVQGQVKQADKSGRVKGKANLELALTAINTTDGQHVPVQTDSYSKEAASGVKGDTAKVAGGAALGALIGGLAGGGKGAAIGAGAGGAAGTGVVLGTRGKEVTLPNETTLTFRLASPVTITEQLRN